MSDTQTLELTKEQAEILKRGLRFVRSAVMLEIQEPASKDETQRTENLQQIARLNEQLEGVKTPGATTRV